MAFTPKTVLHQVHVLDQGIRIELRRPQLVQITKCFLKFRMIIAGLDGMEIPAVAPVPAIIQATLGTLALVGVFDFRLLFTRRDRIEGGGFTSGTDALGGG